MIRDSMKGLGTRDDDLIRLILAYAEASFNRHATPSRFSNHLYFKFYILQDNMAEIKAIFEEKNGKTLENCIESDTHGDYCRFLLTVIGRC